MSDKWRRESRSSKMIRGRISETRFGSRQTLNLFEISLKLILQFKFNVYKDSPFAKNSTSDQLMIPEVSPGETRRHSSPPPSAIGQSIHNFIDTHEVAPSSDLFFAG
jgi:hypothetical protein